jgi:hypothetical protein
MSKVRSLLQLTCGTGTHYSFSGLRLRSTSCTFLERAGPARVCSRSYQRQPIPRTPHRVSDERPDVTDARLKGGMLTSHPPSHQFRLLPQPQWPPWTHPHSSTPSDPQDARSDRVHDCRQRICQRQLPDRPRGVRGEPGQEGQADDLDQRHPRDPKARHRMAEQDVYELGHRTRGQFTIRGQRAKLKVADTALFHPDADIFRALEGRDSSSRCGHCGGRWVVRAHDRDDHPSGRPHRELQVWGHRPTRRAV